MDIPIYIHAKALKRLIYFSSFRDIDSVRAIQSDVSIRDYQSRFIAIRFSLHVKGRFWNVFFRFDVEQIISHAQKSNRTNQELCGIREDEQLNPPVSLMYLARRPAVNSCYNRWKNTYSRNFTNEETERYPGIL